jgi:hypothetical protein
MQCSDDAVILKNYVERERIFEFLAGLNIEFDQIRVQILGKESLPSLNEVFSVIRAEEGKRTVMLDAPNTKGSVMLITYSRNMGDAMNGAEVGKIEGKKSLKMICFVTIARRQVIQRRLAGNSMENHQGWGVMEDTNGISQEDMHI